MKTKLLAFDDDGLQLRLYRDPVKNSELGENMITCSNEKEVKRFFTEEDTEGPLIVITDMNVGSKRCGPAIINKCVDNR